MSWGSQVASGLYTTTESTHFQVSYDSDQLVTRPLFSTNDEQPNLAGLSNRKRKFSYPLSGATADMREAASTVYLIVLRKAN